jgi:hypothetical protein
VQTEPWLRALITNNNNKTFHTNYSFKTQSYEKMYAFFVKLLINNLLAYNKENQHVIAFTCKSYVHGLQIVI